jgi:nicotinamide mononucleotide adenylyltransferase
VKLEEDGLVIMRGQPVHIGHIRLIDTALQHSNFVYLILGSIQEYGTARNPFPFSQRKQMIKNYYIDNIDKWSKLIIIGLPDIFSLRWPDYVLEQIHSEDTPNIKTVFGGTQYDCDWFKNLKHYVVGRNDTEHPYASATMIREMLTYKDPRWKDYIPECNWEIVANKFKEYVC